MVGKVWQQEREEAGHTASTVGTHRDGCGALFSALNLAQPPA